MKYIFLLIGLIVLVSCEHHDMHNQQTDSTLQQKSQFQQVFKYDNSSQCRGGAVAVTLMAQELIAAGIDVLCAQKSRDNSSRVNVCNGATGAINVYQLNSVNVHDALALGFKPVSEIPDYTNKACSENIQSPVLATTKMYKPDGSLQCDSSSSATTKRGIAIHNEIMAQQLIGTGIDVICTLKAHDGGIRATVCGNATGIINVFKIAQSDRTKATVLGFKEVATLVNYRDGICQ